MKKFSEMRKVFVPLAVAVVATVIIQACAPFIVIEHGKFGLIIKFPQQIRSERGLKEALDSLKKPGVSYDIHLVREDHSSKDFQYRSPITIKTDRVITTELAKSLSSDEFTAIGSSITYHVYSPNAEDIAIVLNQIKK